MYGANGRQQLMFLAFDNKARSSQGTAATEMAVIHRVHDHRHRHAGFANQFEKQKTVAAGHADIYQCEVDAMPAELFKSLTSIRRFYHDGNLRAIKWQAQAIANQFMVIGNQQVDGQGGFFCGQQFVRSLIE